MKQKGITLVELMVVVSVIAIVTGMAWPNFQRLSDSIQSDITRNNWIQLMNYSRRSAVDHQTIVTLCPYDEIKMQCGKEGLRTWAVFTDHNKDESLNDDEQLLKIHYATETSSFRFYPEARRYLQFSDQPTGIYSGNMRGLTICPNGKPDLSAMHFKVNIMGRVAASQSRDAEGIIMRESGKKTYSIDC